jgi:choline dehydrogenase-like flavoprotein
MGARGYDHVIVGTGSARSVLANRLTEDRSASVLLREDSNSQMCFEKHP